MKYSPPCPKCKSTDTIPIVYGLLSGEGDEKAQKGEIYSAGCCIEEDAPAWFCKACKHKWGKWNG